MKRDELTEFEASLIGRHCIVRRREYDWTFDLDGFHFAVGAPWRVVANGGIAFASTDHGQLFGRALPVNGEAEARRLLDGKSISSAVVDRQTADLTLHFDATTRIDIFNNSMGYEGWEARYVVDGKPWSIIALGGGDVGFLAL